MLEVVTMRLFSLKYRSKTAIATFLRDASRPVRGSHLGYVPAQFLLGARPRQLEKLRKPPAEAALR